MSAPEYGLQGPSMYFGELRWSKDGNGTIAIFGPTIGIEGGMTVGEVYRFLPPGEIVETKPVVDYEWLQLHLGKNVHMRLEKLEGVISQDTVIFTVMHDDGAAESVSFPLEE